MFLKTVCMSRVTHKICGVTCTLNHMGTVSGGTGMGMDKKTQGLPLSPLIQYALPKGESSVLCNVDARLTSVIGVMN
jgi:hypothetical protein